MSEKRGLTPGKDETGKPEDVKLQDAGIWPEQCPGKGAQKKGGLSEISQNRSKDRFSGADYS